MVPFTVVAFLIMQQVMGMGGLNIEPGEIVWLAQGRRLEQGALMSELARHRIILVGETHDDPGHHEVQKAVLTAMLERGGEVALAMEMFPRHLQPVLDRWIAGGMTETEFLDAVTWYFTWGFDAELYLPLLRLARTHRIPLVAMNIDRTIVSQVRTRGLEQLEDAVKKELPTLAPAVPEYRERLQEVFDSHPMMSRAGNLEYFIDAQRLWDGVMARAIAQWVQRHPRGRIVALAGSGHLLMKHGIPHQLAAMGLEKETVTLLPWNGQEQPLPAMAADFAWGTPPPPSDIPLSRLGVALEMVASALVITEVTPDSPAARAGLKVGDRPLRLDDAPLTSSHTLVRLLRSRERNPRPVLTFLRDNRLQSLMIDLNVPIDSVQ
ncbi:MAG: ChaN family lipoprotein [Magnetococcales bacterium]|nr:ChaN family lipoprotein [Magnetococcales bacterium]